MSENTSKIVTDEILKLAIEKALQAVAENLYAWESFTDDEVDAMFDGTSEEIEYYKSLISDTITSELRLWSSKKISEELANSVLEANSYADSLLADLSSISLKYVESLPDTGDSSTIYILKSTDSNPDTLNLYNGGSWTKIGDFSVSLSDYVTTDAMNTALSDKANDSEVVKVDDILTSTTGASNSNVLSAGVTVSELAKKIDKTSIVNTLSTNSTNIQVPSAKAVYDKFKGTIYQNKDLNLITEPGLYMCADRNYGSHHFPVSEDGYLFHVCYPENGFNIQTFVPNGIWGGGLNQYLRRQTAGTWTDWRRMCGTTVADVAKTTITFSDETNYSVVSNSCLYFVKDGICTIMLYVKCITPVDTWLTVANVPKANTLNYYQSLVSNDGNKFLKCVVTTGGVLQLVKGESNNSYIATFSYPVAES